MHVLLSLFVGVGVRKIQYKGTWNHSVVLDLKMLILGQGLFLKMSGNVNENCNFESMVEVRANGILWDLSDHEVAEL